VVPAITKFKSLDFSYNRQDIHELFSEDSIFLTHFRVGKLFHSFSVVGRTLCYASCRSKQLPSGGAEKSASSCVCVTTNYSQKVINGTLITKILWKFIHIQTQEFQTQTSTEFIVIFICALQQQ